MDDRILAGLFISEMRAFLPLLQDHLSAFAQEPSPIRRATLGHELSRLAGKMAELCASFAVADCADLARAIARVFSGDLEQHPPSPEVLKDTAGVLAHIQERVDAEAAIAQSTLERTAGGETAEDVGTVSPAQADSPLQAEPQSHPHPSTAETPLAHAHELDVAEESNSSAVEDLIRTFQSSTLRRRDAEGAVSAEGVSSASPGGTQATSTTKHISDASTDILPNPPAQPAAGAPASPAPRSITAEELDAIPPEMKRYFVVETTEDLQDLERALIDYEHQPGNQPALRTMIRIAHKIKGSAATLGFDQMAALALITEDVLKALQTRQVSSEQGGAAAVLHLLTLLQQGLAAATEDRAPEATLEQQAREYRDALLASGQAQSAPAVARDPSADDATSAAESPVDENTVRRAARSIDTGAPMRVSVQRLDTLMSHLSGLAITRASLTHFREEVAELQEEMDRALRRLAELNDQLGDARTVLPQALLQHPASSSGKHTGARRAPHLLGDSQQREEGIVEPITALTLPDDHRQWDELELDRYTAFDSALRALAEAVADIGTNNATLRTLLQRLSQAAEQQESLMLQMQQDVIQMRLVPLSTVIPHIEFATQRLAASVGKSVSLTVQGQMTEIDRNISEALVEPLIQLVRNAIVHGIEPADERKERDKPSTGHIWMHAYYVGNEVTIEVGDDGRGINPHRLIAVAMTVGMLDDAAIRTLSREQALGLMFVPGISTLDTPGVSGGRGIGLDEVYTAIQKLKGSISVRSEEGQGTVFRIRVPISLSIVRVLHVLIDGQGYAVPFSSIQRTVALRAGELLESAPSAADGAGGNQQYRVRRMRIARSDVALTADAPLSEHAVEEITAFALAELLEHEYQPQVPQVALIVELGQRRVALLVDEVREEREVVVRALPKHLRRRSIRGATVTPGGEVLLLLDLPELIEPWSSNTFIRQRAQSEPRPRPTKPASPRVLVVDDSVSIRRSLEATLTRAGFEVMLARDGIEAIRLMMADRPQVLVLDIEMPHLDGFELLAVLRSSPQLAGVRVIMLTSRAGEKHRAYAERLGADAYLTKPCPQDVLIDTVHEFMKEMPVRA